jgi:hypothetical protein
LAGYHLRPIRNPAPCSLEKGRRVSWAVVRSLEPALCGSLYKGDAAWSLLSTEGYGPIEGGGGDYVGSSSSLWDKSPRSVGRLPAADAK